ncbi:MAG: aminotransferase class IV [Thermoguttaceae bacterium]
MSDTLAYFNGAWIPTSEAAVSVFDAGFVLGTTVSEQLRTFAGKLFRLQQHIQRLQQGLDIVGFDVALKPAEIMQIAHELIEKNQNLLAPGNDWGLTIFVTPGIYATYARNEPPRPTLCMYLYPLPFHLWAEKYQVGDALVTTEIEQVSERSWPPELKCRSRMHYYLADRLAKRQDPLARAVLLDREGHVREASTANVIIYRKIEGLISPPLGKILGGISLEAVRELSENLQMPFFDRELTADDLAAADEIFLTSTPPCILPVTRFNNRPIGNGLPGKITQKLLAAFSAQVGVDIVAQAKEFAKTKI